MTAFGNSPRAAKVMILGGTTEGRELAEHLEALRVPVVTSLAGATKAPVRLPGEHRVGGFGGVDGLAREIRERGISMLVDATHPFAATITANAMRAAQQGPCQLLLLRRPPWRKPEGAIWYHFTTLEAAVDALPATARPLMATGSGSVAAAMQRSDLPIHLRSIEPVPDLPAHVTAIPGRPPFSFEGECDLLRQHGITHLLTKNAGGNATRAKLEAAAALGLPVMMIDRPPAPDSVPTVHSVETALNWLRDTGLLDTRSGPAP